MISRSASLRDAVGWIIWGCDDATNVPVTADKRLVSNTVVAVPAAVETRTGFLK
jgi:hypothetical protein